MDAAEWIVVVAGIALTVAVVAWFGVTGLGRGWRRPEIRRGERTGGAPTRPRDDATGRGSLPGLVRERPAGPDAEGMATDDPGQAVSGPSPGPPA